jgi:hypothetical protein
MTAVSTPKQTNSQKPPRAPNSNSNSNAPSSSAWILRNTTTKNVARDSELEALKQRGLAKILQKHFTETAAQLEAEKRAADEALADLERRKAQSSQQPQPTKYNELSPLDEMYIKANQWKQETRRKERETVLLYQRYIHKFGDTVIDILPKATPDAPRTSTPLPPQDSNKVSHVSQTQVPSMAKAIEATLEEYLQQGAIAMPSLNILGKEETFQSKAQKEMAEFRNYYRRKLEQQGIDAQASSPTRQHTSALRYVDPFVRHYDQNFIQNICAKTLENMQAVEEEEQENDDDPSAIHLPFDTIHEDHSVVSGLTMQSAVTLLHDCEKSVAQFLKAEQDEIRKIMDEEEEFGNYQESPTHAAAQENTKQIQKAESMVAQMQEILKEYQKQQQERKSHSSSTPNDDDDFSTCAVAPRKYPTENPEEDWYIYYDELYQQEYYHEKNSNRTQWEPPQGIWSSPTSSTEMSSSHSESSRMILEICHEDVWPDQCNGIGTTRSRVDEYRRKRKRQQRRRRRMMGVGIILFVLSLIGSWIGYTYHQYPQEIQTRGLMAVLQAQFPPDSSSIVHWLHQPAFVRQWSSTIPNHGDDDDVELAKQQCISEEQERLAHNEWHAAMMMATESTKLRQQQQERMQKATSETTNSNAIQKNRPWACNLPFSYLFHPRCFRLAHQNPWFDLTEIVHAMMQ